MRPIRDNSIAWECTTLAALSILSLCWFVAHSYVDLIFSDMGSNVLRYDALVSGKIGFFKYLFSREIDHFHALIYALSAMEFRYFAGAFIVTRIIGVMCIIGAALIVAWMPMTDPRLSKSGRWIFGSLVVAFLTIGSAWEAWGLSFQVVVSSYRFLFIAALALACISAGSGGGEQRARLPQP